MSKKTIKYIHMFIWLFAIFANLPYMSLNQDVSVRQLVTYIVAFLYLMVVFYFFYLFMVPKYLDRKKISGFFSISFIVVLIMPFFGYTILFLIKALFDGSFSHFYKGYSLKMHMSGYYPVLTAAIFGSFFRVIINWFTALSQKTELDKQKLAAELNLLKSKLNPHFMFNTLNNIDSLIHTDQEKASEALIRLSDIMRYLTYETSSDVVELDKETDYINNLIELHRLRIKTPDKIIFDVSGEKNVMIAPAIFVPILENAFKFAISVKDKPYINIMLSSESGFIAFEVTNCFDDYSKRNDQVQSGFGIENLRKRLDLLYQGRHSLEIKNNDNIYSVKLTIDTNAD